MEKKSDVKELLLDGYQDVELRPGLHSIDVIGDRTPNRELLYSEWRRVGEILAERIITNEQNVVLVSTYNLEHYLLNEVDRSTTDNTASFEYKGKRYLVTSLEPTLLERTLPDIVESEEFIYCLNVWLCLFNKTDTSDVKVLCESDDTNFVREMKLVCDLCNLASHHLSHELIITVSDGRELFWFNPVMKNKLIT